MLAPKLDLSKNHAAKLGRCSACSVVTNLSKKLLLYACFCFVFTTAEAQYRLDRWTADDGLPQNSVYGIVQANDGYLWMATLDGLARFDGVRFTVFNKSSSPGIINNRFTSLFKAANGDLWAGTEQSGIVRYHDGRFSHFRISEGRVINSISSDPYGNPMISVSGTTAVHFTGEDFSPFDPQNSFADAGGTVKKRNVRLHCTYASNTNYGTCIVDGRNLTFSPSEDLDGNKLRAGGTGLGRTFLVGQRQKRSGAC